MKHVEECNKCIKIENLCIKLVKKKDYHCAKMHNQQNIKISDVYLRMKVEPASEMLHFLTRWGGGKCLI